jgi:hypothetical protein
MRSNMESIPSDARVSGFQNLTFQMFRDARALDEGDDGRFDGRRSGRCNPACVALAGS